MVWKSLRLLLSGILGVTVGLLSTARAIAAPETARATIVRAILTTDDAQKKAVINSLIGQGDEASCDLPVVGETRSIITTSAAHRHVFICGLLSNSQRTCYVKRLGLYRAGTSATRPMRPARHAAPHSVATC